MIVEFLCEQSGGPCFYVGRSMKEAHQGLKIDEKDWNESARLLVDSMTELKVPNPLPDKVVAFVVSLKPDIVGKWSQLGQTSSPEVNSPMF
ncbi:MAG: group 1 truncated hemoglobin [Rhizobiales bacterium]|nr:group 1 truncated hemoglobin [Hyphomicrobiales bacterium]MBI3673647.1 group 1 truncated hemoglobin [Hyphomicrobiales bacterium]